MNVFKTISFVEAPLAIKTPLKDISCVEKEKVAFTCELNKPNVPVKWFKNGKEITDLNKEGYELVTDGCKYTLKVSAVIYNTVITTIINFHT